MVKSLRIAVADDEPLMREYFQQILPVFGHQVVCAAENGQELIECCRTHQPDLVITDINMPVLDGLQAAMTITRERAVPIIVITGFHSADTAQRVESAHVQKYLRKPIKQADLEPAIAAALESFSTRLTG